MEKIYSKVFLDNEKVIIHNKEFLIVDIQDQFQKLTKDEFSKFYNLSSREYTHLVKRLNLTKTKITKLDEMLQQLNKEEFSENYKKHSIQGLMDIYQASYVTISKLIKYFDLHLTQEEINNKVKQTSLQKYGKSYYSQTQDAKKRNKQTRLDKYGDINYNNREKTKQTCLKKYGVTNANKLDSVKEKIKKTCLQKYGDENYFNTEEFKNKAKQTKLERYNDENYTNREKAEKTCIDKYGVKYPNQSVKVRNKTRQTCLQKYGVENVYQSEEIKNKISDTCLEKYGVKFFCMTSQCRESSYGNNSSANLNFAKHLDDLNVSYSREFSIDKYSYDFKINNTLIEINPTATHNSTWGWRHDKEKGLDKFYHQNKSNLARINGYRCVCIWDWDNVDIVLNSILKHSSIYARKCDIREIDESQAKEFLQQNHIQGYVKADISVGLFYKDELVSIMTFGKPRYNKKFDYELLRYCSNCNVTGGANKLFKYFISKYNNSSIISYCDMSKFNGEIYSKLGFKLMSEGTPSKHWYNFKTKQHITDNLLRQRGFDQLFHTHYGKGISNEKLMLEAGFVVVYDCGQNTYVYSNKN